MLRQERPPLACPLEITHDTRFHEIILVAAGNRRLAAIIGQLRDLVRFRGASTVGRCRDRRAIRAEHGGVIAALRERDATAAGERMRAHLLNTARPPLAQEGGGEHALAWEPLVRLPGAD